MGMAPEKGSWENLESQAEVPATETVVADEEETPVVVSDEETKD